MIFLYLYIFLYQSIKCKQLCFFIILEIKCIFLSNKQTHWCASHCTFLHKYTEGTFPRVACLQILADTTQIRWIRMGAYSTSLLFMLDGSEMSLRTAVSFALLYGFSYSQVSTTLLHSQLLWQISCNSNLFSFISQLLLSFIYYSFFHNLSFSFFSKYN